MPNNVIKSFSKKYKIPKKKLEKRWKKAEKKAKESGQEKNYAYIMGIFKKMNSGKEKLKKSAKKIKS